MTTSLMPLLAFLIVIAMNQSSEFRPEEAIVVVSSRGSGDACVRSG